MYPLLFIATVVTALITGIVIGRAFKAADQWDAGFQCAKDIYKRRLGEAEIAAQRAHSNSINGSAKNG